MLLLVNSAILKNKWNSPGIGTFGIWRAPSAIGSQHSHSHTVEGIGSRSRTRCKHSTLEGSSLELELPRPWAARHMQQRWGHEIQGRLVQEQLGPRLQAEPLADLQATRI